MDLAECITGVPPPSTLSRMHRTHRGRRIQTVLYRPPTPSQLSDDTANVQYNQGHHMPAPAGYQYYNENNLWHNTYGFKIHTEDGS